MAFPRTPSLRLASRDVLQNTVWCCCSNFERPTRITRQGHINNPLGFHQVYASTDYYRCSFYPMTIVLWNRLPAETVLLTDLDSFKSEVSKIIESNIVLPCF